MRSSPLVVRGHRGPQCSQGPGQAVRARRSWPQWAHVVAQAKSDASNDRAGIFARSQTCHCFAQPGVTCWSQQRGY